MKSTSTHRKIFFCRPPPPPHKLISGTALMIPVDYHTSCFQENNCEDFTEQFPVKGYTEFDAALEIYLDVCQYDINDEKRNDQLRTAFKDALMDEGSQYFIFSESLFDTG